jgi:GNAT superfamily N-acetyltransferase
VEFREDLSSTPYGEYKFEVLDPAKKVVGAAYIESKQDKQGKFWHLEDLLIAEENRNQGYGSALLEHLRQYLWDINRLRIRVHPAIGQQAMEELAETGELMLQSSEEELDAIDRKLEEAMQQPDFWSKQAEIKKEYSSKDLIEWYKKRGFTIDDPDKKHVWCYPPQGS